MRINKLFLSIAVFLLLIKCKNTSNYNRTLEQELNSGKNFDTLIFGMKLGQTKDQYHDICYQLNKEKKIVSGSRNLNPELILKSKPSRSIPKNIQMSFNGVFNKKNIMKGLEMNFHYTGWSNWNKEYQSEMLFEEIKDSLTSWFNGNSFFKLKTKEKKLIDVKIDGNRQIVVFTKGSKDVIVIVEDLSDRFK